MNSPSVISASDVGKIITTQQDPVLGQMLCEFVELHLAEFKDVLAKFEGLTVGAISVCEAFWLYFLIKAIRPHQIIESGTLYGYSLHFIVEAVDWPCRILSFDVDQSKAQRYPGVEYFEGDWTDAFPVDLERGPGTFVFFDDHMDQGDRLREAMDRDQEHILYHDNYLSLEHSHYPIRFCDLEDTGFCYTFPSLYSHSIFTDVCKNAQTYRWLTYLKRGSS